MSESTFKPEDMPILELDTSGTSAYEASRFLDSPQTISAYLAQSMACHDPQVLMKALAEVAKQFGSITVLVNNAGINIREPIEEMAAANLDTMLAINVKGPFLGIKHAIPLLRRSGGGSIVNMSSICGLVGHKYTTEAYTVTKGAVTLLTKTVGVRYARDNIRCNSIHPSTVDTPLVQILFQDPKKKEERLGEVPLGRLATDLDVANDGARGKRFCNGVRGHRVI